MSNRTIQSIQENIDNKQWRKLKKVDFDDFNKIKQYTYNKEFFLEVLFNNGGISYFNAYIRTNQQWWAEMIEIVLNKIEPLNFTSDDWAKYIEWVLKMKHENGSNAPSNLIEFISYGLGWTNKNSNYIDALTRNNYSLWQVISTFLARPKEDREINIGSISSKFINGLNDNDKTEFLKLIVFDRKNNGIMEWEDAKDIRTIASDHDEAVKLHWRYNKGESLKLGKIFDDLPIDEFMNLLDKYDPSNKNPIVDDITNRQVLYSSLTSYFATVDEISDEHAEKLIGHIREFGSNGFIGEARKNVVTVLTRDQIIKNVHEFGIMDVALSTKFTLDDVVDRYDNIKLDLSGVRLFKEEEIINHPNFFDPNVISQFENQYISRNNWNVLLKAWDTTISYNLFLEDFIVIFSNLNDRDKNLKNIKYLAKKTNASNLLILELVDKYNKTLKLKNVTILSNLIKKDK